jgi:hypothetical protein
LDIFDTYRPDLQIKLVDAPPTGILLVSGLKPNNECLFHHLDEMVTQYRKSNQAPDRFIHQIFDMIKTLDELRQSVDKLLTQQGRAKRTSAKP